MFEILDEYSADATIKVIGVGGGGGNAVQHMVDSSIEGVEFICANTDSQALRSTTAKTVLQLGGDITKGLGAGSNPVVGREAAMEDRDRIHDVVAGSDMLFITAGMGGGTGTGAAPIVAEVAKELGILTVAVVTKPFPFEGNQRMQVADNGIDELAKHVDSLITIPNEKLLKVLGKDINLLDAFKAANDVLHGAVQGIAELITSPGNMNVDFADVRTVMSEMGMAMMGSGVSVGTERAREAAESAISSPLLDDINISGARGILVNITANKSLTLGEFNEVGDHINGLASDDAKIVVGTAIDESMTDSIRVTLVATGIGENNVTMPKRPTVKLVETPVVEHEPVQALGSSNVTNQPVAHVSNQIPMHQEVDTSISHVSVRAENRTPVVEGEDELYPGLLEIPAFLRRQAD